jgi:predicted lipid-binding transport protein (Tim44 family)
MKRIALLLVLLIGLAVTSAARSQQPATNAPPARSKAQALDDLAAAVQALATRIASDPEIKAAAMQVASGVVTTAQQVVAEQSVAIEGALKTAAERISASQSNSRAHSKNP